MHSEPHTEPNLGILHLGIWPPGADGTDINAVCRSGDQRVVATVDDSGKVHLLKYPCVHPNAKRKTFSGHASHVTNCVFTTRDLHLVTTGGADNAIFQFKYVPAKP